MIEKLHNQGIVILLAIGIFVASALVIGGSYYVAGALGIDPPELEIHAIDLKSVHQGSLPASSMFALK
jgi:hypothetical protein